MKNIAIISTSLNSGGAERIAGMLSKALTPFYNVYLFLLNTSNIVYDYAGTIIDIGQSKDFYDYEIQRYKKQLHIDCAISFLEIMNFANIRTRGNERVILSEQNVQSLRKPPRSAEKLQIERYYGFADAIVTCSHGVAFDLTHHYGVQNNMRTIYNFIDKEKTRQMACSQLPGEIQEFLGGAEFLLNVGRIHEQKNQKRLIKQFSIFHAAMPDMKLIILGSEGVYTPPPYLQDELNADIKELNLENHVKIFPYRENPFPLMKQAKGVVVSSRYEGLPLTVLEAMTLGVPVISTDCLAGPRELLMDEKNYDKDFEKLEIVNRGLLVCNDAAEDDGTTCFMAEAMKILCSSPELAERLKRNGLAYMARYENKEIADQWIDVIEGNERKNIQPLALEEERLKSAEHLIIYGAGFVGKTTFVRLSKNYQIECFAVSRKSDGMEALLGVPIREIHDLRGYAGRAAVIVGVGDLYRDEVVRTLQCCGFDDDEIVFPYVEPLTEEIKGRS